MNNIMEIDGIECYEQNGTAYLKLETVARGLGFVDKRKGNEYIRWERVKGYLVEIGVSPEVAKRRFYSRKRILPSCHESQKQSGRSLSS